MNTETHKQDPAESQARAQVASIVDMVAALDVDYDRLEELRDERDALREEFDALPENTGVDFDRWVRSQDRLTSEECDELTELEEQAGDCADADDAQQRIYDDALSVEYRSDWQSPGEDLTPAEFRIVLCTGGPHVEIQGEMDNGDVTRVRVLYKDWGTSGELFDFDRDAVTRYCQSFVY